MKNLTQSHIEQLLLNHIITFKTPSNAKAIGNSVFVDISELKNKPEYPLSALQKYNKKTTLNDEVIQETGYLLPDYHKKLFQYYKPESFNKLLDFDTLAGQCNKIPRANYKEITDATIALQHSAMILAASLYMGNLSCDICSQSFWTNIDNKNNPYPSKISGIAETMFQLFEDINDVVAFQAVLPTTQLASKNLQVALQYKTFVKALQIVPDYSLQNVPPLLQYILLHEKNEALKIETAKALKKYDFNLTKEIYLQAYASSSYKKSNKLLKSIIDENNAIEDKEQLFIEEKNNVVYTSEISINFITLKNKLGDNILLAETLIAIIIEASKSDYRDLEYIMAKNNKSINIFAESYDKVQIENFKNELLQKIDFSISNFYLDDARYQKLNNHFRGRRMPYEAQKDILSEFNELFVIYQLKTDLENNLPLSNNKTTKRKI